MDKREAATYAAWFACLADATRIRILHLLASEARPMKVGEIVDRVEVGQSTVSHHLKRLAQTGFVLVERSGTASFFRVNQRCLTCFPTAADIVMGRLEAGGLDTGAGVRPPWEVPEAAEEERADEQPAVR